MAHHKAADSKREQFRRYLEKSGVLDTLTKVLVALYEEPEKPSSALEYPFSVLCGLFLAVVSSLLSLVILILFGTRIGKLPKERRSWCSKIFLKHHLGASAPESPEVEALRLEVAEMKEKYEAVLEENKKLKSKLAQYEPPQEEKRDE